MAKPPFFPFYYQDFLTGTRFFDNAQTGAYLRLLLDQWDLGALQEKHFDLRMNGMSLANRQEVASKFRSFRIKGELYFQNERMENTRKYVSRIGKIRSDSGKLGGEAKARNIASKTGSKDPSKDDSKTVANQGIQILNPNPNSNSNSKEEEDPPLTRKTRWPKDFELTEGRRQYAIKQGIEDPERVWEDMRIKDQNKHFKNIDWNAFWQSWCRSDLTKKTNTEGGYG